MPPISVMVKPVSGLCNMRCTYCFYADEMARRDVAVYDRMTDETLEHLVRRVFAFADGSVNLAFQGGEPTLAGADFYRRLLALERRYNTRNVPIQHALQTNGLDVSDALMEVLKEGEFLCGISVDGTQAIHDSRRVDAAGQGTFNRVMETADRMKAAGLPYNILCVVDEPVAQHGAEVFKALRGHGYLQFIPCLDPLDGKKGEQSLTPASYGKFLNDIWPEYAAAIRAGHYVSVRAFDNWVGMLAGRAPENCGFLGRCMPNFLVESDGSVYPCDFYCLDEWKLGNVNDNSFFTLAKSPVGDRFAERSYPVHPDCEACPHYALCRGGCCRDRDLGDGTVGKNRLCEGYKAFFAKNKREMEKIARRVQGGNIR